MNRRRRAIGFYVALCVVLVGAAVWLNISWILTNARHITPLVLGGLSFALIIAGLIVYTVFLVLEIKRNEEHDTFINAVTHELKTPIASIRLYLQTLQSRDVDEVRRRQFYDIMLADADRLHQTVDQVLRAGAAGQARRTATRAAVDVGELARESIELARVRHHLQPDAIGFESHHAGALLVRGDVEDLRTALSNLLDNAVKYSGGHVHITVSAAAPTPVTVWIRIQDHGIGIPHKQIKRIFRRFYRVRSLRQITGTGLGLYIVRSIVRAHSGRVFAQSEGEGRGATFTIELPRLVPEPAPAAAPGPTSQIALRRRA